MKVRKINFLITTVLFSNSLTIQLQIQRRRLLILDSSMDWESNSAPNQNNHSITKISKISHALLNLNPWEFIISILKSKTSALDSTIINALNKVILRPKILSPMKMSFSDPQINFFPFTTNTTNKKLTLSMNTLTRVNTASLRF